MPALPDRADSGGPLEWPGSASVRALAAQDCLSDLWQRTGTSLYRQYLRG